MVNKSKTITPYDQPQLYHGITGNYYVVCTDKGQLVDFCKQIQKSKNSIKWVDRYTAFVVRLKNRKHKQLAKQFFENQICDQ